MPDPRIESEIPSVESTSKEFSIRPKTPWTYLAEVKDWRMMDPLNRVTQNVLENASELFGNLDVDDVVNQIYVIKNLRKIQGNDAVKSSVAATLGSLASAMHWNMDNPQVVFMSGYHLIWGLGKKLEDVHKKLLDVETGRRTFQSEDLKRERLNKEIEYLSKYSRIRKEMENILESYAQQNGIDKTYQTILKGLLYIGDTSSHSKSKMTPQTRNQIFKALRENRIDEAYGFMRDSIEAGKERYEYPLTEYFKQFYEDQPSNN